jgi:hypothetical protein
MPILEDVAVKEPQQVLLKPRIYIILQYGHRLLAPTRARLLLQLL